MQQKKNITIVTGLWDLGRGSLTGWANRDFEYYKNKFFEMLEVDVNMCVWIPQDLEEDVKKIRGDKPTHIFIKNIEEFKTWNPFFDKIQEIRNNHEWKNFTGWLSESPQASLEFYNPMMFTKMFMLNDSAIVNPFDTEYFFWIDGALTNTVNKEYFQKDYVLNNLENYVSSNGDKFIHITYPYESNEEIHGFERNAMARYCDVDFVKYVARGGFFGGHKNKIHIINSRYYIVMHDTLNEGLMGADECLFTILCHKYKDIIYKFQVEGNGLIWPFFENLKKFSDDELNKKINISNTDDIALYIITFNSPRQLEILIRSMRAYDENLINKPQKFLLNNSTDTSTFEEYDEICKKYDITEIHKDNIGICGGRQFIAEHADENNFDFYFFFEDDMFFYPKKGTICKNGFNRFVDNIYNTSIEIATKEKLDFLKLSYTEFYGDNGRQWAWYNLPQNKREEYFPDHHKLPERGIDENSPRTEFSTINSHNNVPYITGEIYYSNWPQLVSKEGNKKMFLDVKWQHPFEQTWMSYIYAKTKEGSITPGLLLITPTEHDRIHHYKAEERREN